MPLIYLPLIMYSSWMEFLIQPSKAGVKAIDPETRADAAAARPAKHTYII